MCPVIDHEVHEKVKSTATTPYGCSNKGRDSHYLGQDGWNHDGTACRIYIRDRASLKCRYDGRKNDLRCGECKLPSDDEYLRSYGL